MEFEKAIFRVYERCVEGLGESETSVRACRIFEYAALGGAVFFLGTLIVLHTTYVGEGVLTLGGAGSTGGCLPGVLAGYAGYSSSGDPFELPDDTLLGINVSPTFLAPPLEDDDYFDPEEESGAGRRRLASSWTSSSAMAFMTGMTGMTGMAGPLAAQFALGSASTLTQSTHRWLRADEDKKDKEVGAAATSTNGKDGASTAPKFDKGPNNATYDYLFAESRALIFMDQNMRSEHKFTVYNATLDDACFGTGLAPLLLPLGGVDVAVTNMVMHTVKKGGLIKTKADDYYGWGTADIVLYHDFAEWASFKLSILLVSVFAFFVLSCTTALLVRILISSGVVLLFPIFWLFGVPIFNNRIISLSYPWLGVPMEMLRNSNRSPYPFLMSHVSKIVLYYTLYEAAQFTFSLWFYGNAYPGQKELWLYAIVMLWEYYSMIYVRSKLSIAIFPRASLALFLVYHFYLYSQPTGFHLLALLVMFLFLAYLMAACVRKFEVPCYTRGGVSMDAPRALMNMVPWPTWQQALVTTDPNPNPSSSPSPTRYQFPSLCLSLCPSSTPSPSPSYLASGREHISTGDAGVRHECLHGYSAAATGDRGRVGRAAGGRGWWAGQRRR